jgi:hypothetical protein
MNLFWALVDQQLPPLGDPTATFQVELSKTEINTIQAFVFFVRNACIDAKLPGYWSHYGPTATALAERLLKDYGDKPHVPLTPPEVTT